MQSPKLSFENLIQYVFDDKALDVKDLLQQSIIELVLYLSHKPLDLKALYHEIIKKTGITFDELLVRDIIIALADNGYAIKDDRTGGYFLEYSRKKIIEKKIKTRKSELKGLNNKFQRIYYEKAKDLKSKEVKLALDYFYTFSVKLFSNNSSLVTGLLRCSKKDFELIKNYSRTDEILRETVANISQEEMRKPFSETVIKIFSDEKSLRFLNIMARNYLYFQILNLNPECKSLQKEIFSKMTLLLDTNFIMSLILPSRIGHKVAFQCYKLCNNLGIELKYTPRTIQEYNTQVNQSVLRFRELRITKSQLLDALDDDFIVEFSTEQQKGKHSKWGDFIRKKGMIKNILEQFKISEWSDVDTAIKIASSDSIGIIKDKVIGCAMKWGNLKNDDVALHDSYHLLLIRKLREIGTSVKTLSSKYYFLTFDRTLICADREINQLLNRKEELPASIECWALIEMMLPFLSGTVDMESTSEAFSLLMKTEFHALPARIKTKNLIHIQTRKIDYNKYSPEQLIAVVDDELVRKYKIEVLKVKPSKNKELIEQTETKLEERIEEVAKSVPIPTVSLLDYLPQIISGIVAIIMAIAATYSVLIQNNVVGGVALGALAIICIAISFGYGKIEFIYKELKLILQK